MCVNLIKIPFINLPLFYVIKITLGLGVIMDLNFYQLIQLVCSVLHR